MIDTKGLATKVNAYKSDNDTPAPFTDDMVRDLAEKLNLNRGPSTGSMDITVASSMAKNPMSFAPANDNSEVESVAPVVNVNTPDYDFERILADIARESTQTEVVGGLFDLDEEIGGAVRVLSESDWNNKTGLEKIDNSLHKLSESLVRGFDSLIGVFSGQFTSLYRATSEVGDTLDKSYQNELKQYEIDRRDGIVEQAQDPETDGGVMDTARSIVSSIGKTFDGIAHKIMDAFKDMISGGAHLSLFDKIRDGLIEITLKAGMILLATSGLLDLVVNPEKLNGYFTAFSAIWTTISNIFGQFSDKLSNWWSQEGEGEFNQIGAFVNDVLIYAMGTALPAVLHLIADSILNLIDNGTQVVNGVVHLIKGIVALFSGAGGGEKALEEIGLAFDNIVTGVVKFVWNLADGILSFFVRMFNFDEAIGMRDDQTLFERIGEAFTQMWDSVVKYVHGVVDKIGAYFSDPLGVVEDILRILTFIPNQLYTYIARITNFDKLIGMAEDETLFDLVKRRIKELFEIIMDMLPSYNDFVGYMNSLIDTLPQNFVTDAMRMEYQPEAAVGPPNHQPTMEAAKDINDPEHIMQQLNERSAAAMPSYQQAQTIIQNAINNSQQTTVSNNGGGNGGGRVAGSPSTRPEPSYMDRILQGTTDLFRSR